MEFKDQNKITISKAMRFLSKEQKKIINLYYFEDMSDTEIAQELMVSTSIAKSKRQIAIEAMRASLRIVI